MKIVRLLQAAIVVACAVSSTFAQALPAGTPATGLQAAAAMESILVDSIASGEKSVVAIARARRRDPDAAKLTDPSFVPTEFGTGVVIDRAGLILTNDHVLGDVDENEYAVWIQKKPYRAKIKGTDPWTDLAVLHIEATDLTPIRFAEPSTLRKGQIVIALGNPYAIASDGSPSASWGIISNIDRKAQHSPDDQKSSAPAGKKTLHHYGNLIQTDCKLNLGNSGGPLLNLKGEMIGLVTSRASAAGFERSTGFAIPIDETFKRTVEQLKLGKEVEHGFLGVAPGVYEEDLGYADRRSGKFGARLLQVVAGTPGSQAGLQANDVITHVDGQPVWDADGLIERISSQRAGKSVLMSVVREGKTVSKVARLSKKPPVVGRPAVFSVEAPSWRGMRVDYPTATLNFDRLMRDFDPQGCVAIVDVQQDSPAWKAGLRAGTFLSLVGTTRVTSPDEFLEAARGQQQSKSGQPLGVRVKIHAGGGTAVQTVQP